MAQKTITDTKAEYAVETAPTTDAFACPNDGSTKFHKAEFGELRGGAFVVTATTYRCVGCHTEYAVQDGAVVKA